MLAIKPRTKVCVFFFFFKQTCTSIFFFFFKSSPLETPPKAQLCLWIQTPGGVWLVGWAAPAETLIRGTAWWVNFLRKVKLTLTESIDGSMETTATATTTSTTTTTTTDHVAAAANSTNVKKSKRNVNSSQ